MRGRHSNQTSNNWLIPCFFLFDCILLAAVVVLWYFMQWQTQTFTLHDATIPCTDIAHYSYPEKVDIIPETIVFVLAFVLPPIVVLFGEAAVGLYNLQGGKKQLFMEKSVMTFGMKLHALLRRTVRFTGIFLLGAFITWILTRAGQLILSRPAPDFFSKSTCTPCTGAEITFTVSACASADIDHTARQSFPSLYASLSAYASIYVTVYITMMMKLNAAHTLRPFAGLCFMAVPYLLGMQQVAANRAHWTDVIAGWILGGVVAIYLIYGILDTFLGPLMSAAASGMDVDVDANDDYVIGNGHARNGTLDNKPIQMNGLRQSQRDRDGYLDRGMEVNGGMTYGREEPFQGGGVRDPNAISGKRVPDGKSRGVEHYMY